MQSYFNWLKDFLLSQGFEKSITVNLNVLFNILVLLIVLYLLDLLFRKVIIIGFKIFTNKTRTTFDDFLVKSNFPKYIGHIIPLIVFRKAVPYIFSDFVNWKIWLIKITDIYIIILSVWIIRSIVKTTVNYLKTLENFKDKPLYSYAQVIVIVFWFIGGLLIFTEITEKSIFKFLATLGAASAVLLLIFKDTILGFVASIQVSINDMVRIGDWISMEKYGADGDVIEITLATVKVSNWDKTITTIPTYALISDSFKNWRGMQESGGRRIKKSLTIKLNSIKFLTKDDLAKYSKIQVLKNYIIHRQADIDKYNTANNIDKELLVNGRNQTNLGLFRKYCTIYLENTPGLNKNMTMMVRHLKPNNKGIPIEIYAFSADIRWINYEHIAADIFEHIIAAAEYFDLELYQEPSSSDLLHLKNIKKDG